MKIKILSSAMKTYWYSDRIGDELYVDYNIESVGNPFIYTKNHHYIRSCDSVITELPESFCVKICHDDKEKWEKYIQWLSNKYVRDLDGFINKYYGVRYNYTFGKDVIFGTEIHIDDMIKHIDYMERHIKGGEQFSKESQLIAKMDKILKEEEFDLTTLEGRLAYAKKHYPIGCTVIEVSGEKFKSKVKEIHTSVNNSIKLQFGAGLLYNNITGEWAEIIKEEGKEFDLTTNEGRLAYAKQNYPIGTKYFPLTDSGHPYSDSVNVEFKPRIWVSKRGFDKGIEVSKIGLIYHEGTNRWAEIIKEEINMGTQRLSRQGLKEIHSVACSAWKQTLEQYGSRNPLEDYIELSQEEVNNMFDACTKEQLPIVSKYLKKEDDGSVDVTEFNTNMHGFCDNNYYVIRDRQHGSYSKKSFLLSSQYNWEIKTDELGELCLIPTKKK